MCSVKDKKDCLGKFEKYQQLHYIKTMKIKLTFMLIYREKSKNSMYSSSFQTNGIYDSRNLSQYINMNQI